MPSFFLASQSPRRRELLHQIGVVFDVLSVDVPEEPQAGESPQNYVQRLARSKSEAGARLQPESVVLGADTIVVAQGRILEKPQDREQAIAMLLTLSASTHHVMTAVSLTLGKRNETRLCISDVSFRAISEAEAKDYWHTGEPKDKAGGYGIQGLGAVFVESIKGSYSNVVGLPLFETHQLLKLFQIPVWRVETEL